MTDTKPALPVTFTAEQSKILAEVREVSDEMRLLEETLAGLRQYRVGLCAKGRRKQLTTRQLGNAAGVSGVAVTLWLKQPA